MSTRLITGGIAAALVLLGFLALSWFGAANAADHGDAPLVSSDQGADIADVYAFHNTASGTMTTIVTFGSGSAPLPLYEADVLYSIHIDTDMDNQADHSIEVRFGQNTAGAWGVQAINVPGSSAPLAGAVATTIVGTGVTKLFAGMVDDPFFFDLQGFQDTLATSTLAFDNTRDSFAGKNVMAIAIEMPLDLGTATTGSRAVWATTGRQ